VTAPLVGAPQLPRGTVPGLSAPSPAGNLANLFPVVTPAPVPPAALTAPRAGKTQYGPTGASAGTGAALTADTGVMGTGQGRLIVLTLTLAAGFAAFGMWFTFAGPARKFAGPARKFAGPARKLATSLTRRRGHRTR
jgi:hypothetical protein